MDKKTPIKQNEIKSSVKDDDEWKAFKIEIFSILNYIIYFESRFLYLISKSNYTKSLSLKTYIQIKI